MSRCAMASARSYGGDLLLCAPANKKHCICASGAEVAEPAQRATELARRRGLQGHRGRRLQDAEADQVHFRGMLQLCAAQTCSVIVDGKVAVGRRRRHQAGMRRCRPQGQSSPLWPQWASAWPLVPRSRTLERPTLGSVRFFCTICNVNVPYMCHILMQRARTREPGLIQ